MSVLQKVEVKVDSMDMLKRVLDRMGKAYKEDKTTIKNNYGQSIKCDLYLVNSKVGFRKEDDKYVAEADWMESGMRGEKFTKEFNETASQIKVEDACKAKHLTIGRWTRNKKGNLEMVATSWS